MRVDVSLSRQWALTMSKKMAFEVRVSFASTLLVDRAELKTSHGQNSHHRSRREAKRTIAAPSHGLWSSREGLRSELWTQGTIHPKSGSVRT